MSSFWNDLRFALRMFARNPAATAVAVVSLAVAIGPNATLFTVVDRMFLKPPPVQGLSQLFTMSARTDQTGTWEQPSYPDLLDYEAQARDVATFVAVDRRNSMVTVNGALEIVPTNLVGEEYFTVLGVRAAAGRVFSEADARFDGAPPAVISYAFWQRKFGGAADAVGKPLVLNHRSFYVAGIAPRAFRGPTFDLFPVDIWLPLSAADVWAPGEHQRLMQRSAHSLQVLVRLKDGVAKARAEAVLTTVTARLARQYPDTNKGRATSLVPAWEPGRTLFGMIVLSLVGLVLLIACANIAGILLAQGEARRREFAVRLSMGAPRSRLIRQVIAESMALAAMAAALGLAMAYWLIRTLPALKPPIPISIDMDLRVDARVLAYTTLLAVVTALAAGLIPALRVSRPDLTAALRGDAPGARGRFRFRGALVVAQVAFSEFLLAGAGLLVHSYLEVRQIHPGFDPDRKVLLGMVLPGSDSVPFTYAQLVETLEAVPGVRRVASVRSLPLSGSGEMPHRVSIPGLAEPAGIRGNFVGPGYLSIMGTRMLRGRDFQAGDAEGAVIVNEAMARRFWGTPDAALGQFVRVEGRDGQVAGVVENGKYVWLLEDTQPYFYRLANRSESLVIETATDPTAVAGDVRRALGRMAPGATVASLVTLRQHMRLPLFAFEISAGLIAIVAALGIFLAGVGLYGLIAHSVNRRAHEFGVRMALGARPRDVLRLVLRDALSMAAIGAAIGLAGALAAARLIAAFLYRVSPADPIGLSFAVLAVAAVALAAAHLPARRAVHADPMAVLRRE